LLPNSYIHGEESDLSRLPFAQTLASKLVNTFPIIHELAGKLPVPWEKGAFVYRIGKITPMTAFVKLSGQIALSG